MTGSPIDVAGGEKLYVWWGRYNGSGTTGPTVTPGSDHCIARIAAYSNVSTDTNPIDVSNTGTESTSDTSFSFNTGLTTTAPNEICIAVCSTGQDSGSSQFSAMANTSLTSLAERMDNNTNSGGGGGFALDEGFRATAGTVGTWTATLSNASPKSYISFAFKPEINTVRLSISNDGGTTYTEVGSYNSSDSFSYNLPSANFVSNFKMRFYLDGYNGTGESASLDNIGIMVTSAAITAKPADTNITFTITRNDGTYAPFTTPLTADYTNPNEVQSQGKDGGSTGQPADGYYYGCRVDVTELVNDYSNRADLAHTPTPILGNGNAQYTIGGVYADSLKADGSYGTASFAGWSLVIVYSSQTTLGHQLYLYDLKSTFTSVPASPANTVVKQISGFIVPKPIVGETEVAKLTCFVGEGDIQLPNDYIAIVDQRGPGEHLLWDGVDLPSDSNTAASPRNVWNGRSTGSAVSEAGIDVDTFTVPWGSPPETGILRPGDTSASIDMYTNGDGYVTVYMILSFRSKVTTGGSISYLIRN